MAGQILTSLLVDKLVSYDLITCVIIVFKSLSLNTKAQKTLIELFLIELFLYLVPPLPNSFSIFIRFSANFTSIVPSGNASSVLDNIRITVSLLVLYFINK